MRSHFGILGGVDRSAEANRLRVDLDVWDIGAAKFDVAFKLWRPLFVCCSCFDFILSAQILTFANPTPSLNVLD